MASGRGIDHRGRDRTVKEDLPSSHSFYTIGSTDGRNTLKSLPNNRDRSRHRRYRRNRGLPCNGPSDQHL